MRVDKSVRQHRCTNQLCEASNNPRGGTERGAVPSSDNPRGGTERGTLRESRGGRDVIHWKRMCIWEGFLGEVALIQGPEGLGGSDVVGIPAEGLHGLSQVPPAFVFLRDHHRVSSSLSLQHSINPPSWVPEAPGTSWTHRCPAPGTGGFPLPSLAANTLWLSLWGSRPGDRPWEAIVPSRGAGPSNHTWLCLQIFDWITVVTNEATCL